MTQTKVGKLINNLNIKLNENIKYNVKGNIKEYLKFVLMVFVHSIFSLQSL